MRLTLVLLASSLIALAPMGLGIHGAFLTGGGTLVVLAPDPPQGSITYAIAGCDSSSAANGIDAHIYTPLPGAAGTHQLRMVPSAALDVDVYFFDANCVQVGGNACAQLFLGAAEQCGVPAGTVHVLAYNFAGAGTYTIKI